MNYDLFFFSAHGDGDNGASGNGQTEYNLSCKYVKRIVELLRSQGLNVHTNTNGENNYHKTLVRGNSYKFKFGYVFHINSFKNESAKGMEFLVPINETNFQLERNLISELGKYFESRGIKSRDYYNENFVIRQDGKSLYSQDWYKEIREAWSLGNSLTISELGFISNSEDVNRLVNNFEDICLIYVNEILKFIGKEIIKNPTTSKPENGHVSEKWFRVICGSFRERENAEKRLKEVKEKGFDGAFLEVK